MKKFKKVASLALVAALAVSSFTACGNNASNADATTFKIGGIGPITGAAAVYGQAGGFCFYL